jgi:hypothetical protein
MRNRRIRNDFPPGTSRLRREAGRLQDRDTPMPGSPREAREESHESQTTRASSAIPREKQKNLEGSVEIELRHARRCAGKDRAQSSVPRALEVPQPSLTGQFSGNFRKLPENGVKGLKARDLSAFPENAAKKILPESAVVVRIGF